MREKMRQWMHADTREDVKRFVSWLRRNRKSILVVLAWGIAMALITSKGIWAVYLANPTRFNLRLDVPFFSGGYVPEHAPRLVSSDYVLFVAVGLIAGLILGDFEIALYSYLAAVAVLFLAAVVHAFLFIWFVLGKGSMIDPSFTTSVMFAAFLTVLRLVFPSVLIVTFFGNLFGVFLSDFVQPIISGINARFRNPEISK